MNGYRIIRNTRIAEAIFELWIEAPLVAKKHRAGQFVITRFDEHGERVPFTVVETIPAAGQIRLIVQIAGKTTAEMAELTEGEALLDVVGPLGHPTHIEPWGNLLVIGGGVGCAPLLPITKAARAAGNKVHAIIGARSKSLMILEDEFRAACDEVRVCTDDGTHGTKGLVTDVVRSWVGSGTKFDYAIIIGPVIMMKAASIVTRELGIPALASLNPIMVDGTGMCGACRVTVHGQTRFACVEGPEFDAHGVDFDELILRNRAYRSLETEAMHEYEHRCKLREAEATLHG